MEIKKEKIIVRYPPSPTGKMHIGNTRCFITSYLVKEKAKLEGKDGIAIMRFEDTDRERSKKEFESFILKTLDDLKLTFEEGPYRQSERTDRYVEVLDLLIKNDLAYEGEESKDGSGKKVIRFRNPNEKVTFTDLIRGEITIDTTDFGDFPIARSKENPLYLLTVVVDDVDMNVTHIIRGEDHITTTPRNILIFDAVAKVLKLADFKIPNFAHVPLLVGEDNKKLGKRHGAVTWEEFENNGYLPEALVNYLVLLGWHPKKGSQKEIFSSEELISEFRLEDMSKSPAKFDYTKLKDINKAWMLKMDSEKYNKKVLEFLSDDMREKFKTEEKKAKIIIEKIIKEKISYFGQLSELSENAEFDYYFESPNFDEQKLIFKDGSLEDSKKYLAEISEKISEISESDWTAENLKEKLWDWSGEVGRGKVLHPMRTALSGADRSPDPFTIAEILGKTETLKRLKK